jgi:ribonuclease P protein subunit POP4
VIKTQHYTITPENVHRHELIGLQAKIKQSTEPSRNKIKGKITNETKNTITIQTTNGEKKIPKNETTFEIKIGNQKKILKGKKINAKPCDRIKMSEK